MCNQKRSCKLKALSLFLAMLLISSLMPSAFAVTALTKKNVTVWPTASGTMYYGQTVGEAITLSGGEVQYNGTVVEGEFSFLNPSSRPIASESMWAQLRFTPKDTTQYSGFDVKICRDVTYVVLKATPVLVDEVNDKPRTEGKAEQGALLSTVSIVGGELQNPYYSVTRELAQGWTWTQPETVLSESGYYEATSASDNNYNTITYDVYVEVAAPEIPRATVTEAPTVPRREYAPNLKWGDIALVGGKADVPGKFELTDEWKARSVTAGSFTLDAVFTPDDLTARSPAELQINAVIEKARCKFVDDSGKEFLPEMTLSYGVALSEGNVAQLKKYLNLDEATLNFNDPVTGKKLDSAGARPSVGTHELDINVVANNKQYEGGLRKFKLTVTPAVIAPALRSVIDKDTGNCSFIITTGNSADAPQGSFDIYLNGELYKSGIKYGKEFSFAVGDGSYEMKAVYRPVGNDNYSIADIGTSFSMKLPKQFKAIGADGANSADGTAFEAPYHEGDAVVVTAAVNAKSYYKFNGWEVVEGEVPEGTDLSTENVKFAMPDCDLTIQATWKFSLGLYIKSLIEPIVTALSAFWAMVKEFFSGIFGK